MMVGGFIEIKHVYPNAWRLKIYFMRRRPRRLSDREARKPKVYDGNFHWRMHAITLTNTKPTNLLTKYSIIHHALMTCKDIYVKYFMSFDIVI